MPSASGFGFVQEINSNMFQLQAFWLTGFFILSSWRLSTNFAESLFVENILLSLFENFPNLTSNFLF